MKAIDKAKEMYKQFESNFEEDLKWFTQHGHVVETDDNFWFFRRHPQRDDCWAIQIAVGDISLWEKIIPFYLPYTAWGRRVKGRGPMIFSTNKVFKMIRAVGRMKQ